MCVVIGVAEVVAVVVGIVGVEAAMANAWKMVGANKYLVGVAVW